MTPDHVTAFAELLQRHLTGVLRPAEALLVNQVMAYLQTQVPTEPANGHIQQPGDTDADGRVDLMRANP